MSLIRNGVLVSALCVGFLTIGSVSAATCVDANDSSAVTAHLSDSTNKWCGCLYALQQSTAAYICMVNNDNQCAGRCPSTVNLGGGDGSANLLSVYSKISSPIDPFASVYKSLVQSGYVAKANRVPLGN